MNTISQHMTDEEIIDSYKNAIKPKLQVDILCDRALVDKKTMVNFLYEKGLLDNYQISAYKRSNLIKAKENKEQATVPSEPEEKPTQVKKPKTIPAAVRELVKEWLESHHDEYENAIALVKQYEEMEGFVGDSDGV